MRLARRRTSLGGEGALDARTLYEMDAFGGGALAEVYTRDSPCSSSNYPQLRFEPLLRRHAEQRRPCGIRFNHELVELSQNAEGVSATIVNRASGETLAVRARYLIAADGGKTVGAALGIVMEGPTGLGRVVTTHISADLSPWWDDACLITWFINPESGGVFGSGAMVPMGPTWGRHSEEWVVHFSFAPDDPPAFDEVAVIPRLRALLKLPELEIKVHKVSDWILEAVIANRYREGSVFLAGDSAHRHPPTTGLGLNTAIQDAHNLAWKLAAVLSGPATDRLLDSYTPERRPIGVRNVDWAMFTALNHQVVDAGFGLTGDQGPEMRRAMFEAYFADTPMAATRRARATEVIQTQRTEFQAHDIEIGFSYDEGAFIRDGSPSPVRDPMGASYQPTSRPGHRLPHAWIERAGERISTHDLVGREGAFALIVGGDSAAWRTVASAAANKYGVVIAVAAIGDGQEYTDPDGAWVAVRGITDQGAILVRPDNHVAWRSDDARERTDDTLVAVFSAILIGGW